MKKLFAFFSLVLMAMTASAQTTTTVDGIKYILDGTNATVTYSTDDGKEPGSSNPNNYTGSIVIPATIEVNGMPYSVTAIGKNAFSGCVNMKTVKGGKNVKTIGEEAFNKCKKAKTIKILGTALKKVGANAFAGTPSKATVTCPKKKIKAYTKLLQKAGLSKKAVFKELK